MLIISNTAIFAHVKWFVTDSSSLSSLGAVEWLATLAIVSGGIVTAYFLARSFRNFTNQVNFVLSPLRWVVPVVIRVTTGLALVIFSINGTFYTPVDPPLGEWLLILQLIIGVSWIFGIGVRYSSIVAGLLYLSVAIGSGFITVLEHLEVLAASVYLFLNGPTRFSLDAKFSSASTSDAKYEQSAGNSYRILIGVSLAVLALSEKLLNPGLAQSFLANHQWNILASFGVTNSLFIAIIGGFELLFGILIILNLLPRLVTLAVLGTMVATAFLLGITEVYGHLFAVGLVALVWLQPNTAKNK